MEILFHQQLLNKAAEIISCYISNACSILLNICTYSILNINRTIVLLSHSFPQEIFYENLLHDKHCLGDEDERWTKQSPKSHEAHVHIQGLALDVHGYRSIEFLFSAHIVFLFFPAHIVLEVIPNIRHTWCIYYWLCKQCLSICMYFLLIGSPRNTIGGNCMFNSDTVFTNFHPHQQHMRMLFLDPLESVFWE